MVGVNVPIPVPVAQQSFGGWKGSLFGDLHMYGPEGMQFYTRAKVVTSRWPDIDDAGRRPRLPTERGETMTTLSERPDGSPQRPERQEADREFVFHSWSAQATLDPMVVAGGSGSWFWDEQGKRYLDFASQLVNLNMGHQHPAMIAAIAEKAAQLCTIAPVFAEESRSRAAQMIAGHAPPGSVACSSPTVAPTPTSTRCGWPGSPPDARRCSRPTAPITGRRTAMALTGEPRRWGSDTGMAGVSTFRPLRLPLAHSTRERGGGVRAGAAAPGRRHHARRPEDHRGNHPRVGRRHERHPRAAAGLPRRGTCAVRPVRNRVHRRRGDERFRPLR